MPMTAPDRPLKATVSVLGRFHAFYLARELQEAGCLDRLITSYPVFETVKYGVRRDRIRSLLAHEIASRLWRKLPPALRGGHDVTLANIDAFDRAVARRLTSDSNLLIAWSGSASATIRRAKALGMTTFLERGSAHIEVQQELLREEYALCGVPLGGHHPGVTERELAEYELTDHISVPSGFARDSFIARGVAEEKLRVNPYGVDFTHFPRSEKPDDVFRVIYCGALSIRKGVRYLLQAFQELDLPNSELLLIGSRQAETEQVLARHASDKIRHAGPFPEFELHRHYRLGSVFCLPSIEDGFAMVLLQAMACGLPIIATTNTGGPDLVTGENEGFIVPIRDVEALKEKILYLYENPKARHAMADAARARVERGFSWADYGARAITDYRRALEAA